MTDESAEDRDLALYKIMINEGWPQEDVVAMIATGDRVRLDELLARERADTERRKRDVEILTPDQIVDGIVDLNAAKIRAASARSQKEMDAEEAHWNRVRDQLMAVMMSSELHSLSLISATLRALLEVLQDDGTDFEEAKKNIANVLNVFR